MATALTRPVRLPEQLDLSDPTYNGEKWRKFKRVWQSYYRAAKVYKDDLADQVATLLNIIGDAGLDLYETFVFDRPAHADPNDADLESHITRSKPSSRNSNNIASRRSIPPSSDTLSTLAHSRAVNRTTSS